jgi:hypothetical protein
LALWILRAYEYEFPVRIQENVRYVEVPKVEVHEVPITTERIIEKPVFVEHTNTIHPPPEIVEREKIVEVEKVVEREVISSAPWEIPEDLLGRAGELIDDAERNSDKATSGEYKRHIVYARLLKEFPNIGRKKISLAIEVAICSG